MFQATMLERSRKALSLLCAVLPSGINSASSFAIWGLLLTFVLSCSDREVIGPDSMQPSLAPSELGYAVGPRTVGRVSRQEWLAGEQLAKALALALGDS